MKAPMLTPPTRSTTMPALQQHLEHAEMGERARAAAGEHDAHRAPGEPPRHARDVARGAERRPDRERARRRERVDPAGQDRLSPARRRSRRRSHPRRLQPSSPGVDCVARRSGRRLASRPRARGRRATGRTRPMRCVRRRAAHHDHLIVVELAALDQRGEPRDRLRARILPAVSRASGGVRSSG